MLREKRKAPSYNVAKFSRINAHIGDVCVSFFQGVADTAPYTKN